MNQGILSKLRPHPDRIIISIDKEGKNFHKIPNGQEILLVRNVENLNRRETMPVNAVIVYSDKLAAGTEVLVHHNSFDPNNELFDIFPLSGEYEASDVKYFSIKEDQCFLYREGEDWLPCHGFCIGLRLFKPVNTIFEGILPDLVKGQLLITSGEYKGMCCLVVANSDYEIVYQGSDGREKRKIRLRHFETEEENEREEIVAVDYRNTELYNEGKLLAGLTDSDAKAKGLTYTEEPELMSDFADNYMFAKQFKNRAIAKKWFHGGCKEGGSDRIDLMAVRLQDNSCHHFDMNSSNFQSEVVAFFRGNKTK